MQNSPFKSLMRLHSSQRMLVFGVGILITLMTLLTFVLLMQAALKKNAEVRHNTFFEDHAMVMMELDKRADALRMATLNAAMAWKEGPSLSHYYVDRYREQHNSVVLSAGVGEPTQRVVGRGSDEQSDEELLSFFSLGNYLGRATVQDLTTQGELFGYFFSLRHDTVGMVCIAGARERSCSYANREQLMALLGDDIKLRIKCRGAGAHMGKSTLTWIRSMINPITGTMAFRIAAPIMDKGQPFAVLVIDYDPQVLLMPLIAERAKSSYLIATAEGDIVAEYHGAEGPPVLPSRDQLRSIAQRTGSGWLEEYRSSKFTLSRRLGDTGWVLVLTQNWSDVVAALGKRVGLSAAITLFIIVLIWTFLISFKLRVVRPWLNRSERLFESEELSRTLIGTAPVGLGLIDVKTGQALLISKKMAQIAERITPTELNLSEAIVQRYKYRLSKGLVGERHGNFNEDMNFPTTDEGGLDLSIKVAKARYQGNDVLVAALMDVTVKRRLESRLREAKRAADQANKAKSAFLAAMSHEIRTPLNAILGNLELLAHSQLDAVQRDRLKTVWASSSNLLAIVSDVLDFSKIEAGELGLESIEFDALEVVSHALIMFAPMAHAKGLSLLAELGSVPTLPMRGDPVRLGQIVQNLLSNAIKFTPAGQVLVRMRVEKDAPQVVVDVTDTGIGLSQAQIAKLFRAFSQADSTIGRRFGGTGLGLALCLKLTQGMGGTLTVGSEPVGGSRFTLILPLKEPVIQPDIPYFNGESVLIAAASDHWRRYLIQTLQAWNLNVRVYQHPAHIAKEALEQAAVLLLWGDRLAQYMGEANPVFDTSVCVIECTPDGPGEPIATGRVLSASVYSVKGLALALRHALQGRALARRHAALAPLPHHLRVLVAEDNAANRMLLCGQLRLLGCEVQVVENADRALAALRMQRYDLLLTDLSMPGMGGYELAAKVRQHWPLMPVIAVTADVTQAERDRCMAAGMAKVLGKPLLLADLQQALFELAGVAADESDAMGESGLLGKTEMPEDMKLMFLQSCRESVAALRTAWQIEDGSRLQSELHTLKGLLGVCRLHDLGRRLVDIGDGLQQEKPGAMEMLELFLQRLEGEFEMDGALPKSGN